MTNQPNEPNRTAPPSNAAIDWLWIIWAVVYSGGFAVAAISFAIPNAATVYFVGLIALAALKYLIRFNG
jgi:hypothetical protein